MASAEAAPSSSLGPRYAPEDPTLPNPWKGLIDGGTGILYYWNPETNVTQYDRPVSVNPPLPPGPPPVASAPKMASLPMVGSAPLDASATQQQQQKLEQPAIQQPQSVGQQTQHSQPVPYHQMQPTMNQQTQQQYLQLQLNQIQYPLVSYCQGQLMDQQLQQQAPQVPFKQQQEGSQVLYQRQQALHAPYQQQPHQEGSQFFGLQQQQLQGTQLPFQQHQQLQGSNIPVQQQQQHQGSQVPVQLQQQRDSLICYQQLPQQQVSNILFQMGQLHQVSQTSHQQGQQQPEGSHVPPQQKQGFQVPLQQQQQQESLVTYQQQPQQQVSKIPFQMGQPSQVPQTSQQLGQQQLEGSNVPLQQKQGFQVPSQQQQQQQLDSLVSYQQQPQQQVSRIPFQMGQPPKVPQTSRQLGQQPEGSSVPLQQKLGFQVPSPQQQQQQQDSLVSYQEQPQQQVSKVPFRMGQPPQVPHTSHQQGQQQPQVPLQSQQGLQVHLRQQQQQQESLVSCQQQPQQQLSKIPFQMGQPSQVPQTSHQRGQQQGQQLQQQQLGSLKPEELVQQEGKEAGQSVPQVQQPGVMPSNHQLSGPATQTKVSQGGLSSVQLQQSHFGGQSSGGRQFELPSGGQHLSGLSSGVQSFSGLSSGGQRFTETSAGGQHFSRLSSGGQQFTGQEASVSSGGQQCTGQSTVSSVLVQPVGTGTTYQLKEMSSPVLPKHVGLSLARPMGLPLWNKEDRKERLGNEFLSSGRYEEKLMPSLLPKLAPLPQIWNLQDMRTGSVNRPSILPSQSSELNVLPGRALQNQSLVEDAASIISPQRMFGAPEFAKISAAVAYRQHHDVTAMGHNIPAPFMTFESTGFPPEILREMHSAGFRSPTPVQAQTWPVALQSRDLLAIAKTGSGKVLCYLIPALILLRSCRNNPQFGPTVLVLAPTRELATLIQDEAIKFGRSSRVLCACLYGGIPKGPQLREIERGADIIIATPDRLNDILNMKRINLSHVSLVVLDEADRMLEMGFEPQIRMILNEIPKPRQTLMYTATWPKEVRKIAGDLLVNPIQVNVGSIDELATNKSIVQHIEVVPPEDKQGRLEQILRSHEWGTRILVFCSTKRLCDQLARGIGRTFAAASIHGDKSRDERDYVLSQFCCGKVPILVATDVVARGFDIQDIRVVINYDFPMAIEDYIHRIGMTGRAGAMGVSYTFFSYEDWKDAPDLIKVLEGANQWVPPEVREMAARGGPSFSRAVSHGGVSCWDSGGGGGRGSGRRESDGDRGGGMSDIGVRGSSGGLHRTYSHGERGSTRGREVGGPRDRDRHSREPRDRYCHHSDRRGRGRASGRGRRGYGQCGRDRSYSRSPNRVHTRGYNGGRSRSRSRSLSRSRSRSSSWSRSRSRSRSRSQSDDRPRRKSLFTDAPGFPEEVGGAQAVPKLGAPAVPGFDDVLLAGQLSPMSPGRDNGLFPGNEIPNHLPVANGNSAFAAPKTAAALEPGKQQGGGEL